MTLIFHRKRQDYLIETQRERTTTTKNNRQSKKQHQNKETQYSTGRTFIEKNAKITFSVSVGNPQMISVAMVTSGTLQMNNTCHDTINMRP